MALIARLKTSLQHAWNAFTEENLRGGDYTGGYSYGGRPDRMRVSYSSERSIIGSIYTRLAIDVAEVMIRHVRLDEDERYIGNVRSGLDDCLTVEANTDQAGRHFRQDMAYSTFEKGVIAVVPVETSVNPNSTGGYDIKSLRVGEVTAWFTDRVRVLLYNEKTGIREEITLPKKFVAIIENPLYTVMNEPNSTLQRLIRKLNLLDGVDEATSSGKLDMIIQLPYVIKSEARRQQAEQRRKDIEFQLKGSQYGIAYADGTEKITQLNRPSENNLLKQIEYLTAQLYNQLGLTEAVMNGTADEAAMKNYFIRTIDPMLDAITEALRRTFLTKTARTQGQSIEYYRNPFKLVPMGELADIADKLSRNEIASPNDIRQAIGWKPSKDKRADELRNSNMPQQMPLSPTEVTPGKQPPQLEPARPLRKPLMIETGGNSQNGRDSDR